MIKKMGVAGMMAMIAFALVVNVSQASAQAANQFVGKWTITFDAPAAPPAGAAAPAGGGGGFGGGRGGGGPTTLDVTQTGGTLAATITGGFGGGRGGGGGGAPPAAGAAPPAGAAPAGGAGGGGRGGMPVAVSDVTVVGGALVLKYVQMGRGGEMPVTLTLTPDGTSMKVSQVNGQVTRTGTAVKTP